MAHPMKGACTDKKARLAKYANGGAVSVAAYSRAPKGSKAPKGYADGGVVEDLAAPGMDAMPRADKAPRGKSHVTNVNITMAPKEPALPPPMPMPEPPMAAAPPPPMPMPPMKNGGRIGRFKDGGAVKKAKPMPVRRHMGGPIPVTDGSAMAGVPGPMPGGDAMMPPPSMGLGVMDPPSMQPGVMPPDAMPSMRPGPAMPTAPVGMSRPMLGNKIAPSTPLNPNRPVGGGGMGGRPGPGNPLAIATRQALRGQGVQGGDLRSAMGAMRGAGAFRGGRGGAEPMFKDGGKVKKPKKGK